MNRSLKIGCLLLMLFVASGATCRHNRVGVDPLTPAAFVAPPTLDEIIYAVNANTNRVQQLESDNAWLSLPGLPRLRTSLKLEREHRFRLTSKLIGPELDIGSNDDLFWFWAKRNPEQVVYYASHSEFAASSTRSMLSVDPLWLIDAIGLVRLEPGGNHEGPFTRDDGRVEVRTRLSGEITRVLVLDGHYGWIVEQHLLDSTGRTIASSRTSGHQYNSAAAVSLPHRIEIEMPDAQLSLTIEVNTYSVNSLYGSPDQLWNPQFEGYTYVNIASPQFIPQTSPTASSRRMLAPPDRSSRLTPQPTYRGHSQYR